MIESHKEYKEFIKKEGSSIRFNNFLYHFLMSYLQFQPNKRFLLLLRTSEYYLNCKKGLLCKFVHIFIKYHKYRLGMKLGFSIPENVADKGLQLPHYGTIVINANTKIGKNCRIHVCTNIGTSNKSNIAPIIGDNVYISPGVKIYGAIKLASNIKIAPNAAVSMSFNEENVIVGGVPAKIIKRLSN